MNDTLYPPAPPLGLNNPDHRYSAGRTPSPTPSEVDALTTRFINWRKYMKWQFWARKSWIKWYIIGTIILVITILVSVFDKQIVNFLTPTGKKIRNIPFGWLIPIAILFVISFPPLFGHEIIAILVGVIWGLGIGFAIVAAGTFLGEVGNFYAFKYLCRARGGKMEKTNIQYACLAQVVREGGFKMALLIRLSVIPGHFSTAVFSTCGMSIFVFALAALLSLPKQLITVYIGVILEESGTGTETTRDKVISDSVLAVTILITVGAMWFIWKAINEVKPRVIYARRKARQVKLMADYGYPSSQLDNPSTALLHGPSNADPSLPPTVSSPKPHRPKHFSFLSSQNEVNKGSGAAMGYGGYGPNLTMMQGRYGEPLDDDDDEEKRAEEWEGGAYRVGDLRSGINPTSPGGKIRFQTTPDGAAATAGGKTLAPRTGLYPAPAGAAPPILAPPPRDPPRGGPAVLVNPPGRERAAYPNPWEMAIEVPPPGLGLAGYGYGLTPVEEGQRQEQLQPQMHPSEQAPPQTRRAFQLSDPPVTTIHHHIPSESSTTSMFNSAPAPQSLSMSTSLYPPPSGPYAHTREYTDSTNSSNVFDDRYAGGRGYHQQEYTSSSQESSNYAYPSQQQQLHQRDASFVNTMQDMHSRHAGGGHGAEPTDASFYTAVGSVESGEGSDRGGT